MTRKRWGGVAGLLLGAIVVAAVALSSAPAGATSCVEDAFEFVTYEVAEVRIDGVGTETGDYGRVGVAKAQAGFRVLFDIEVVQGSKTSFQFVTGDTSDGGTP